MAGKTVSFTIPAWSANLIPNLLGLVGLATICVMVAFLTDWRWGGLAAGIFATLLAAVAQLPDAKVDEKAKPAGLRKVV